jgi:hypothetical protein
MSDQPGPSSVPSLPVPGEGLPATGDAGPGREAGAVPDTERVRYLTLLDKALDRGLLDPYDYELRVREVAEATSVGELQRIVTELPAFTHPNARPGAPVGAAGSRLRLRSLSADPAGLSVPGALPTRSRRSRPWSLLVAVVVVVLLAFAVLAVFVEHEVHSRPPVAAALVPATRAPGGPPTR